ncbi:MAG: hypothetical protein COA78_16455 [Blastopirellula sp.]|nr:MAG: hypothetical protein COA78_16455 [Blastopirellula sp.]
MISKQEIERDLIKLKRLYEKAPDTHTSVFYSKLAILELSSWIELSFDKIVKRSINNKLTLCKYQALVESSIKRNNSFSYKNHFIPMLQKISGLVACEDIETKIKSSGKFEQLTNELTILVEERNKAAHVGVRHTTYDAPSVTIQRFKDLYPTIKDMYTWSVRYCS